MKLELHEELIKVVGADKVRAVADLIDKYGIEVITPPSSISVQLPNIEINSIGEVPGPGASNPVRSFQFRCKINGQELKELRKVEIDPFDYSSGEILNVKLTLAPIIGGDSDKD